LSDEREAAFLCERRLRVDELCEVELFGRRSPGCSAREREQAIDEQPKALHLRQRGLELATTSATTSPSRFSSRRRSAVSGERSWWDASR
jgi:hypothetical protein